MEPTNNQVNCVEKPLPISPIRPPGIRRTVAIGIQVPSCRLYPDTGRRYSQSQTERIGPRTAEARGENGPEDQWDSPKNYTAVKLAIHCCLPIVLCKPKQERCQYIKSAARPGNSLLFNAEMPLYKPIGGRSRLLQATVLGKVTKGLRCLPWYPHEKEGRFAAGTRIAPLAHKP